MQSTPEFLAKFCFKLAGILPNHKSPPLTKLRFSPYSPATLGCSVWTAQGIQTLLFKENRSKTLAYIIPDLGTPSIDEFLYHKILTSLPRCNSCLTPTGRQKQLGAGGSEWADGGTAWEWAIGILALKSLHDGTTRVTAREMAQWLLREVSEACYCQRRMERRVCHKRVIP